MSSLLKTEERQQTKHRDSNIELFRIITMLLIVAHHYVVNSGLTTVMATEPLSGKTAALYALGAFGKTGINCFVLITGYFMCQSKITAKKFFKLLLEIYFYKVIIFIIFALTGYEKMTFMSLVRLLLPFTDLTTGFTGCFLVFYLTIPFLTILVKNLNEKQHLCLITLILSFYVLFVSIPFFNIGYSYVSWFMCLFVIASYFRMYPRQIFKNTKLLGWMSLVMLVVSWGTVLVCNWVSVRFSLSHNYVYFFLVDSNKVLAVVTACIWFLFFKNLKIKYSPFINAVASSTFGVLIIHANSDAMRQWLWKDTLKNAQMYSSFWCIPHTIGCVIAVFSVCVLIDYLRIKFIERPVFMIWDRVTPKLLNYRKKATEKLYKKYNIN